MATKFQFNKGQYLLVDGLEYVVIGGIEFYNANDGSLWQEYKICSIKTRKTCWLSIDNVYNEYAIYEEHTYNSRFEENNIIGNGYHRVDAGTASVRSCFGIPDTEPNDSVYYTEYEDSTEEKIISFEQWEDETEYSTGYYLDRDEISVVSGSSSGNGNNSSPKNNNTTLIIVMLLFIFIPFCLIFILTKSDNKNIEKYLKSNSNYVYETSVTSDLNTSERADVYTTTLSVDTASKHIIDAISGNTEQVQESDEDDSVAILTANEYCLIYTGTDNITRVQISSRAYVYQSTNTPHRCTSHTYSYYRRFYYSNGYYNDSRKYNKKASGYDGYDGDLVSTDYSDPYYSYSSSVRQSSVNSRSSSGGGISSGK